MGRGHLRSFVSSTADNWDDGEEEGGSGSSECSGLVVDFKQCSGLVVFDITIGDLAGGGVETGPTEDRSGWGL